MTIYDTSGFCDNRLALTDNKIIEYIKSVIIEWLDSGCTFKGFLITESVMDDIFNLLSTLSKLYTVAGPGSKNSVIVIVNKFDMVSVSEDKFRNIENYCCSKNLKYVNWSNETEYLTPLIINEQTQAIFKAMALITPFNGSLMIELES